MKTTEPVLRFVNALKSVEAAQWNALANPPGERFDPFLSWEFLEAMESSGAATPRTGWQPWHVLIENDSGHLIAAMPLYAKGHSRGEYVFDHAWADALQRTGGQYYPKLLAGIPFTPVTGRRLFAPSPELKTMLIDAATRFAEENELSSLHLNFVAEDDLALLAEPDFLRRQDQQFHWFNRGYESFDAFLTVLSSEKRKNLRKERQKAQAGLVFRRYRGADISDNVLDRFFEFYMDTGSRKWGSPYLNSRSFTMLRDRMADRMLFIFAEENGDAIAGALNFIGSDTLYGRYWGTLDARPMLHFETCYYQAIDYAIEHGLACVEAGAQGDHKMARGYQPVITHSAHWIAHPGLRDAVGAYLDQERKAVNAEHTYLKDHTPFRKSS